MCTFYKDTIHYSISRLYGYCAELYFFHQRHASRIQGVGGSTFSSNVYTQLSIHCVYTPLMFFLHFA